MSFRLERETIMTGEEILAKNCEQSVELDYILPDYYPDIFRLVKCTLNPCVVSQNISGDKVIFELSVEITVWYCGENSKALQTITQKLNYSKTVDAGEIGENVVVKIKPRCDYVNCRAVNQRRLDIRGAVSCSCCITAQREQNVICDAHGSGIQLLKSAFSSASESGFASKSFIVEDEFDLGVSKPPVLGIIRSNAVVTSVDKKIVSGKLVAKGDISVNLLYLADDGANGIENMQFSIPFSQIMDMNNIDDGECILDAQCSGCDISIVSNEDGEQKTVKCSAMLNITALLQKNHEVEIVTDAYSTEFACNTAQHQICIDSMPVKINEIHSEKENISFDNEETENVCGVWASAETVNTRIEQGTLVISGKIKWCVLAKVHESYTLFEKETVFEHVCNDFGNFESLRADISACVVACTYTLSNSQGVTLKCDVRLSGCVVPTVCCNALTDIVIDENIKENCSDECALKLYFADEGEKLWDIAKKYRTSAKAVIEENGIDNACEKCGGMLMIPMVSN